MTAPALSNSETVLSGIHKELKKLGAESVNVARPKLGIYLVGQAYAGNIAESDTEALYNVYLSERERVASKSDLAKGTDDGNGLKANVSKCRQLVKLGMLPDIDGPKLIDRTVALRVSMLGGDDKIKAPFDAFVDVAREQIKQPDDELTDEQIMSAIRKAEAAEKDTIAKLVAAYRAATSLAKKIPMPETEAAAKKYAEAIVEAGGEVPPMTKEEKKEAEAMAFLAKRGMIAVGAIAAQ